MATTFQTLYTQALRRAQLSASDTEDLAAAKVAVNEAYLTVCGDGTPWDFLQREGQWATQVGADTYTFAAIGSALSLSGASIREVIYLTDDTSGGRPIPSMSWDQLEGYAASSQHSQTSGPPVAWAKWGDRIRVWPRPDAVYSLGTFMYLAPDALSGDSDAVLIPDSFASAVVVPYAAALLLEDDGGNEAVAAANVLRQRHAEALQRMRVAHGSAKAPTFNVVSPDTFADLDEEALLWGWST